MYHKIMVSALLRRMFLAPELTPRKPSAFLFDVDGVLLDTAHNDRQVHHILAREVGETISDQEATRRSQSYLLVRPEKKFSNLHPVDRAKAISKKITHILLWNQRYELFGVKIYDGILEQIEQLRLIFPSVPMILMSNAHSEYVIKHLGHLGVFDDIICSDHQHLGELKSCRTQSVIESRGLDINNAVIVTDGPNDVWVLQDFYPNFLLQNIFVVGWGILGASVFDHLGDLPIQKVMHITDLVPTFQHWSQQRSNTL